MPITIQPPPLLAGTATSGGLASRDWSFWFTQAFQAILASIDAIEGNTTGIGGLTATVNLAVTNLTTLQAAVTALQARATADEATVAALQAEVTADEVLITALTARVTALEARFAGAITHTSPSFKLTGGGANGSQTFTGGVLTAAVDPT